MSTWLPLMLLPHSALLILAILLAVDAFRTHSWRLLAFAIGFALVVNGVWVVANHLAQNGPGLFHGLLWSVDYWGFFFVTLLPQVPADQSEWIALGVMFLGALVQGLAYSVIGSMVLQHRKSAATVEP